VAEVLVLLSVIELQDFVARMAPVLSVPGAIFSFLHSPSPKNRREAHIVDVRFAADRLAAIDNGFPFGALLSVSR
jgi:hypothetical protein